MTTTAEPQGTDPIGIVSMTNREYHEAPGISKTQLDLIARSPAHYHAARLRPRPEPTDAMLLGTAVHALVLEPETWARDFLVLPDIDGRTKAGKEAKAAALLKADGRTVIKADTAAQARQIAEAVRADAWAAAILRDTAPERSVFWRDGETGVLCKCRPDCWRDDLNYLIDLKVTANADPKVYQRHVLDMRYHVQAAWYMNGVRAVAGKRPKAFVLLVVEREWPYIVTPYRLSHELVAIGEKLARDNLSAYAEAERSGVWHGYGKYGEIIDLMAPAWA